MNYVSKKLRKLCKRKSGVTNQVKPSSEEGGFGAGVLKLGNTISMEDDRKLVCGGMNKVANQVKLSSGRKGC